MERITSSSSTTWRAAGELHASAADKRDGYFRNGDFREGDKDIDGKVSEGEDEETDREDGSDDGEDEEGRLVLHVDVEERDVVLLRAVVHSDLRLDVGPPEEAGPDCVITHA